MRRLGILASIGCALIAFAGTLRLSAHDRVTTAVTWDREIAPIVASHCIGCHSGQPGTAVSLASYEAARPWARAIRQQVLTRRMPVWRAARGYGEFANDPSLSPFEIALVVAWADGGAPKSLSTHTVTPASMVGSRFAAVFTPPASSSAREQTLPCGGRLTPTGRLLGIRPQLVAGGSVRVTATWPNGDRRVLGWFRNGDPADQTVYWLRAPLDLRSGASIVAAGEPADTCALTLMLK
ncbi:MAG TPA: hypothetical protein VFV78_11865 [Vicinamibacterales bacterium]|nr:hypothetical protein [Vicinamibacterales bacterium]